MKLSLEQALIEFWRQALVENAKTVKLDTTGAMGRMFITMIGSIAELEKSILVERIKSGMRRAKLEGRRLGRAPLNVDRNALVRDRLAGMSLTDVAAKYRISRASVVRVVRDAKQRQMVAA